MTGITGSRILLGVDHSFGARSAVGWAAAECRLRGGAVLMVHVPVTRSEPWAGWFPTAGLAGWLLLDELTAELHQRYPGVAVEQLLGHGDPAGTLTDLTALADLVVLGTTGGGSNLTSLIGSVSSRLAAQAHCPVVIVPEQPALPTARPADRTIVVGVSDTAAGRAALDFAFDEAARRQTSVTAVRGWQPKDPDEDTENSKKTAAQLDLLLAGWHRQYPAVPIRPVLLSGHPAQAVLQAARDAELVVIGAHHSDNPWSSRLGPVPQTVLHQTRCPVVLVGTPHRARHPQPVVAHQTRGREVDA
jgi:nucleotide-binding universal stress UspA family protein